MVQSRESDETALVVERNTDEDALFRDVDGLQSQCGKKEAPP